MTKKQNSATPKLKQQQIQKRAFELWVEAGKPEGRSEEFWFRAEKELKQRIKQKAARQKTPRKEEEPIQTIVPEPTDSQAQTDLLYQFLDENILHFTPTEKRADEAAILFNMMQYEDGSNIALVVNDRDDALPVLAICQSLYEKTNKDRYNKETLTLLKPLPLFWESQDHNTLNPEEVEMDFHELVSNVNGNNQILIVPDPMIMINNASFHPMYQNLLSLNRPSIHIFTLDEWNQIHPLIKQDRLKYSNSFQSGAEFFSHFASLVGYNIDPLTPDELYEYMWPTIDNFNENVDIKNFISSDDLMRLVNRIYERPAHCRVANLKMLVKSICVTAENSLTRVQSEDQVRELIKESERTFFNQFSKADLSLLEAQLNAEILGQEEAISQITKTILARESGLNPKKTPVVMGFFGPSGVGKTESAKVLSLALSGSMPTVLNMSEYHDEYKISSLFGSAPGLIGSDKPGILANTLKHSVSPVIVLDEIEKASPVIQNAFLGIFSEGTGHDTATGELDFSNTTFILTSNAGIKETASMGFGSEGVTYEADMAAVEESFKPEFLGRMQAKVLFKPLGKETINKIIDKFMEPIVQNFQEKTNGTVLTLSPKMRETMVNKSLNPKYGARPLETFINQHVIVPLSMNLNDLIGSGTVTVDWDEQKQQQVITKTAREKAPVQQEAVPPRLIKRRQPNIVSDNMNQR